jgi:hypothetical protein
MSSPTNKTWVFCVCFVCSSVLSYKTQTTQFNKQNKHITQTTQMNKQQTHNTDYTDEQTKQTHNTDYTDEQATNK